jgi:CxxC-x17-CxxC domain-containing protein
MKDFKKRQGGGGRDFSSRPKFSGGFKGKPDRGDRRDMEMFQAICASCSKSCEVPFRPNGKKPVYCKDCFDRGGSEARPQRFEQKRDFAPHHPMKPPFKPEHRPHDNHGFEEMKRELEMINVKLEKLIGIMSKQKEEKVAAPIAEKKTVKKAKAKK